MHLMIYLQILNKHIVQQVNLKLQLQLIIIILIIIIQIMQISISFSQDMQQVTHKLKQIHKVINKEVNLK